MLQPRASKPSGRDLRIERVKGALNDLHEAEDLAVQNAPQTNLCITSEMREKRER